MRNIIALTLSLFVCNYANAQVTYELPAGCYVAFNNPSYCFDAGQGNSIAWQDGDENQFNLYGPAMSIVMRYAANKETALNQCATDFETLRAEYLNVYDYYSYQYNLAKRLKRKCGSKCRTIK